LTTVEVAEEVTETADEHEYQRKKRRRAWQILTEAGKALEECAEHRTYEDSFPKLIVFFSVFAIVYG
jgi:hypothetical protein